MNILRFQKGSWGAIYIFKTEKCSFSLGTWTCGMHAWVTKNCPFSRKHRLFCVGSFASPKRTFVLSSVHDVSGLSFGPSIVS